MQYSTEKKLLCSLMFEQTIQLYIAKIWTQNMVGRPGWQVPNLVGGHSLYYPALPEE